MITMMDEKQETVGEFLVKAQLELSIKRGHLVSDTEMSKYLGVSNYSYSQWKNNVRKPVGDNVHRIAAKLGPRIYILLDQPPLMPNDPELRYIAERWYTLTEDQKAKIIRFLQNNDTIEAH